MRLYIGLLVIIISIWTAIIIALLIPIRKSVNQSTANAWTIDQRGEK